MEWKDRVALKKPGRVGRKSRLSADRWRRFRQELERGSEGLGCDTRGNSIDSCPMRRD